MASPEAMKAYYGHPDYPKPPAKPDPEPPHDTQQWKDYQAAMSAYEKKKADYEKKFGPPPQPDPVTPPAQSAGSSGGGGGGEGTRGDLGIGPARRRAAAGGARRGGRLREAIEKYTPRRPCPECDEAQQARKELVPA